jgi:hypothetical protein
MQKEWDGITGQTHRLTGQELEIVNAKATNNTVGGVYL